MAVPPAGKDVVTSWGETGADPGELVSGQESAKTGKKELCDREQKNGKRKNRGRKKKGELGDKHFM